MNSEQQVILENAIRREFEQGRLSRRQFLQLMVSASLGMAGIGVLGAPAMRALAQDRGLTPTFYQWIIDLHPSLKDVNATFEGLNFQIAPVQGFDVARFIAEGKNQESTWDVYVGMTPFVEMASLIKADVIEPWDNYIPKDVLDDMIPSIRAECTVDGKLYSWPFLLDVIVQGYNSALTTKAGIEDKPPADWDEYLANSQKVLDSGAARYGCTFDSNGWRSLAPITHSISTDVYYKLDADPMGLYDFTSEPAIQALEIMKKMLDLSSANALQPGTTDGGVNNTPDEVAFASQAVAYYIKYQNAPLRFANKWPDPKALRMAALPKAKGGAGATVFWTTGACLFKYGKNKEKAAEYLKALTYNSKIWQDSIAGSSAGHPGHLPPYKSIYAGWEKEQPDWLKAEAWVPLVRGQLDAAQAIPNHAFGLQQFVVAKPIWEKYLRGENTDIKAVMQECKDAVAAEIKKVS
jgi:ABC-type glycerol-3-phosphate transport system substrate-binding protein